MSKEDGKEYREISFLFCQVFVLLLAATAQIGITVGFRAFIALDLASSGSKVMAITTTIFILALALLAFSAFCFIVEDQSKMLMISAQSIGLMVALFSFDRYARTMNSSFVKTFVLYPYYSALVFSILVLCLAYYKRSVQKKSLSNNFTK